jgi:hypothetical protein
MVPARFFCARFFAARFFPKTGEDAVEATTGTLTLRSDTDGSHVTLDVG